MVRGTPLSRAVITIMLGIAISGCGIDNGGGAAASPEAAARPPITASPAALLDDATVDLLTPQGRRDAGQDTLDRALSALTTMCMAAAGHPGWPADNRPAASWDQEWLPDMDFRRQSGYGLSPKTTASAENNDPETIADLVGSRDQTDQVVVAGMSITYRTEGCLAQGRRDLFGDLGVAMLTLRAPETLAYQLWPSLLAGPGFDQVRQQWHTCMVEQGYAFDAPKDARADTVARWESASAEEASPYEIAVAVADGTCALSADAPLTLRQLVQDALPKIPAEDQQSLTRVAGVWPVAVARAEEILRQPAS